MQENITSRLKEKEILVEKLNKEQAIDDEEMGTLRQQLEELSIKYVFGF